MSYSTNIYLVRQFRVNIYLYIFIYMKGTVQYSIERSGENLKGGQRERGRKYRVHWERETNLYANTESIQSIGLELHSTWCTANLFAFTVGPAHRNPPDRTEINVLDL